MINSWVEQGRIKASYRNAAGELEIRALAMAEYAAFVKSPDALKDDPGVIEIREDFPGWWKLLFVDWDARRKALDNNPTILYEADVNPVRRFMSDHKCKLERPKRCYLDIETDSDVPFSLAVEGYTRLLSFACYGEDGNKLVMPLDSDNDTAEAVLWSEMWRFMGQYDQIAAWGGDRFDFAVKKKRSEFLAKKYSKLMAPFWEHRRRLLFVDHLACFRRHHMAAESGDDKTSFKLGDVCQALIGEGKEIADESLADLIGTKSLGGSTRKLWNAGGDALQKLLDYNLQDAVLEHKLELETGYLELQDTIAEVTQTFANSYGLQPMPQVDGFMLRMAHERKTHLPSKHRPDGTAEQYEGAFVFKPEKLGIHRTVHVCDFKSLYPTVIRTFNISPETKGGEVDPSVAFRTGVAFDNVQEGMLPEACRTGMELREFFKQEFKKDPNNKSAERESKAYKIFCNSMYGVIGCVWSRFYDPQIAESITLGAKHLNDETAKAARDRGWDVVYMDTDSLFVTGCTVEEFKEFVAWCNSTLYPRLLDEQGCPREQQCIALDYEKCFDRLIFPLSNEGVPAAKRYIGSYLHYAFKPKTKPEIRGLEYMRGDSVRLARRMQKEVIDLLLAGAEDPEKLHEWVKRKRELFFDSVVEADDISKSAGIGMALEAYRVNAPHVRVAKEMAVRGEDVSEGTRIAYIVADARVSPSKVIPVSEFDGVSFDRTYYWSKAIYPCVMRVLAGALPNTNWRRWHAKYPKPVAPGQLSLLG